MNYIISEETKNEVALLVADKLMTCEAPDRPFYEELLESISALTPVKSDGVVTREVIGQLDINKAFTAHLRNWGRGYPTNPTIVVTYDELSAGLMAVHALQLPVPTPRPEARVADLSGVLLAVKTVLLECKVVSLDVRNKINSAAALIEAHLQQAQQCEPEILGGGQIEEADRRIMERSFEQLGNVANHE